MTLDVVVVSYRSRDLLKQCLDALRRHPPRGGLAVTVVDNDSRDGTVELLRVVDDVDLVEAGSNLGFGAAANLGAARGTARYLLVLNPDTHVTAGCLDRVLDVVDAHPEVGAAGCRLERPDGSFDHAARRAFPTILGSLGHFLLVGRSDRAPQALTQYRTPDVARGPVDAVNGAFMFLRRKAFEAAGGFDEGYWMFMEDLDLCYRLAQAGWTTWYEPDAVAVHVKHGSFLSGRSPRLERAFHHGMLRFYRKHYAPQRNPLVNLLVYAGIGARLALAVAFALVRRAKRRRP